MKLTFHGAAETVTGSRFLVESEGSRLLVDCGLFQGIKRLRQQNWEPFPVDPATIDAVVLTHAHIDHCGYLPALVRNGFSGPIWCSHGTGDLLPLMLLDSAHLQEEDARFANRHRTSRHDPALPLYTTEDAEEALTLVRTQSFHHRFEAAPGLWVELYRAGHILGAATVRVADSETSIFFTGDVGRPNDRVMRDPEPPPAADYLVTESTYGLRSHVEADVSGMLAEIINETLGRGGAVLLPSFAVGRTQTILTLIADLKAANEIPDVPVFLNSPMAIDATEMFCAHHDEHRLSNDECLRMRDGVRFVRTADESKLLTPRKGPMIVLSASGMATGGRILHHLRTVAPDHRNAIVFTGFQASGTRGDAMVNGAREVKIFGDYVPIRADVYQLEGLSAHADHDELLAWLGSGQLEPRRVFVVHGEAAAADAFRRELTDRLHWVAHVPVQGESHTLNG